MEKKWLKEGVPSEKKGGLTEKGLHSETNKMKEKERRVSSGGVQNERWREEDWPKERRS